jgi:sulfite reductase beta subunit-like hemoprotein
MDKEQSKNSTPNASAAQYAGAERILGVYPQRQQGLFMQRIKILGGRIGWQQWRRIIELVRQYSKRSTIHITTRQDIEMHDIAGPDLHAIQKELAQVGLMTHGAGGDYIRNITVCTGCKFDPRSGEIFSIAKFICEQLTEYPCDLPRKFKISFSGCSLACAKPWVSDLGFVLGREGHFTVIGAGSLGPRPATGIVLYENLVRKDVLPMCLASLEFFRECGDRENRSRARLRHVREKLGDERFKSQLAERFDRLVWSQKWPDVPFGVRERELKLLWRLQLPNGNIGLNEALQLADAAEPKEAQLRINPEHGLELFGVETFAMPEHLAALENLPIIVACPGLSSCAKAITDTWAAADAIRQRIAHVSRSEVRICISGCPNSCAHSAIADIGLTGLRRILDGQSAVCFRIFTGGGNGRNDRLAQQSQVISASEVPSVVAKLLQFEKQRLQ